MHNAIKSIDHPVIAVHSLEAARGVYERLGFTVPPRGSHVEWGTGNWCIMFPEDYLELRGIIDPARFTLDLDRHLAEHGEGMMGLAFGTTTADAAFEQMRASGVAAKAVRALARNFELPEGWVQPRFRLCFPEPAGVEGLMHVVVCEHLTPELIRRPEYLVHANGVAGVLGMVGVIEDAERVQAVQRRLLGADAVERAGGDLRLTLPSGQVIELLSPATFTQRYGRFWPDLGRRRSVLPVLRLRVADIDATARCLAAAAVAHRRDAERLMVGPRETCGVLFQMEMQS